jgi:hypothetical protein
MPLRILSDDAAVWLNQSSYSTDDLVSPAPPILL